MHRLALMLAFLILTGAAAVLSRPALAVTESALQSLKAARLELASLGDVLSAGWLIGQPVHARNGTLQATVQDLIVGEGGRIRAMIVQAKSVQGARGGLFKVPWSHVELTSDYTRILVPLTGHNVHEYRLRRARFAANERRLSMMLSARIALRQGEPYGTLADIVFSEDGDLRAVLVDPFGGNGYSRYAYPYRHESYRGGVYTLDYEYAQLGRLALPDASTLPIVPAMPQATGSLPRTSAGGQVRHGSSFPFQ